MPRFALVSGLILGCVAVSSSAADAPPVAKPNILFIVADDK